MCSVSFKSLFVHNILYIENSERFTKKSQLHLMFILTKISIIYTITLEMFRNSICLEINRKKGLNHMINKINDKEFNFMFNEALEMQYALIGVALKEYLIGDLEEKHRKIVQKQINIIENIEKKLSSYIKWELQYFFHAYVNACMGLGQLIYMGYIRENPHIDTIEEMIQVIEKSDVCTMFSYVVEKVFYENKNKNVREMYQWEKTRTSLSNMLDLINELEFYNEEMKQKLIECIENAEETKQRYCLLLKQFYEKAYKLIAEEVRKLAASYIKHYENQFNRNAKKFSKKYFVKDIKVFAPKINVHISYFKCAGSDYWSSKEANLEWIVLGTETDKFYEEEPEKEKVLNFLKLISDKRRMDIIELLGQKPWYVNEIAEEIGMSAATTSYHLTSLQELGIVDFERYNHRFYYNLNKDRLKELFNEAMKIYLHD